MSSDADKEFTVAVTITPRQARRRAMITIPVSLVLIVLPFLTDSRLDTAAFGLFGLCWGVYDAVQAARHVTRTLVRIDRSGITTDDGMWDCRWDGAILVWVGRNGPPLLTTPQLLVYTRAGVNFARRASMRPYPVSSVPLPIGTDTADFCRRLRHLTDARVVDGDQLSLRDAKRLLTG